MSLHFSMHDKDMLEHTNARCHLCTFQSICRQLCNTCVNNAFLSPSPGFQLGQQHCTDRPLPTHTRALLQSNSCNHARLVWTAFLLVYKHKPHNNIEYAHAMILVSTLVCQVSRGERDGEIVGHWCNLLGLKIGKVTQVEYDTKYHKWCTRTESRMVSACALKDVHSELCLLDCG